MNVMKLKMVAFAVLTLTASCGKPNNTPQFSALQEEWDRRNDPRQLQRAYEHHFANLPTVGTADRIPWPDTYWPSREGGLAARWNGESSDDSWNYELFSEEKVKALSHEDLDKLSPAEKYDIFIGNYEYEFVKYERQRTKPDDEGWFGLCHGWAPAAIAFKEPAPISLKGPSGIEVPFGSSDIKALLTFAQQHAREWGSSQTLGGRCNKKIYEDPDAAKLPECRDTNAGSFHIVLANQLGLDRKAFVADVHRDFQVWNQPIYGFETKVIEESDNVYEGAAPGTVKIVRVETRMKYVVESSAQYQKLVTDPDSFRHFSSRTYNYSLELNADGKIAGGEWADIEHDRPDFLWVQTPAPLQGYFANLRQIYEAATTENH